MVYFPMMMNLNGRRCLVVGGGMIACRKVRTLLAFGAAVTAEAPSFCRELLAMPDVRINRKEFDAGQLNGYFLVVAATDDRKKNHEISVTCRDKGILVNAVDQPEDCDFVFPAYIKKGDVVASFCSGGNSPLLARYLREQNRRIVTDKIGEIADRLGSVRNEAGRMAASGKERKAVYEELLSALLAEEQVPDEKEILEQIKERLG